MTIDPRHQIHAKIILLASQLGKDARNFPFDGEIPAAEILDSAAIMELILWLEDEYGIAIPEEDFNLANLGTIDAIAAYLARRSVPLG